MGEHHFRLQATHSVSISQYCLGSRSGRLTPVRCCTAKVSKLGNYPSICTGNLDKSTQGRAA